MTIEDDRLHELHEAYDTWARTFDLDSVVKPELCWTDALDPGTNGAFLSARKRGCAQPMICIARSRRAAGPLAVTATMWHEMAHYKAVLAGGSDEGHDQHFCEACQSVERKLGRPITRMSPDSTEAKTWPPHD